MINREPPHHSTYNPEKLLENTESITVYSNDDAILMNANLSYAITESIKYGDSVSLNTYKNMDFFSEVSHYEVGNELRKAKNLTLTINSLSCRAAEEGGAPIVYVRTICAGFAQRIEDATDIKFICIIREQLLTFYCQTVQQTHLSNCDLIAKACYSYLLAHLSEGVTMSAVASHCNVSYAHLSRIIKKNFHCSFSQLLHKLRIERACVYLHSTRNMIDVAERVGYKNSSQFCHSFQKIMGVSPRKWRKKNCCV